MAGIVLVLVAILSCLARTTVLTQSVNSSKIAPENILNLDFGLLSGLDLKPTRETLEKCGYNLADPAKIIESALSHFKNPNWEHAMEVFQGALRILDFARAVLGQANPCFSDEPGFIEMRERIENLDFKKIFKNVIANGATMFEYVKELTQLWSESEFAEFGEKSGQIVLLIA